MRDSHFQPASTFPERYLCTALECRSTLLSRQAFYTHFTKKHKTLKLLLTPDSLQARRALAADDEQCDREPAASHELDIEMDAGFDNESQYDQGDLSDNVNYFDPAEERDLAGENKSGDYEHNFGQYKSSFFCY